MSKFKRLLVLLLVAVVPLACSTTQPGQPNGARPEIVFDEIGGIWQPARGVERKSRPAIPDGQRYRASGPYQVNVREIPANERRPANLDGMEYRRGGGRMESQLPDEVMDKLRDDSRFLRANPRVQEPVADSAAAPALAPATAGAGFASMDLEECCGGGGSVPPDPELAAGPNHVIAVVNVAFEIYDTDGVSQVGPTTFASFFASDPNCTGEFDPNANYDESEDRFIIGIDGDGSDYCIAVSQTGDPTGSWFLYSFQTANSRDFFDYPHLGVGEDAIFMGANIFGRRSFKEGRVWAIDKSALYAGNSPTVVSFGIGDDGTPQPMNLHGWNQGTWPSDGVHYILTDGPFDGQNYGVWSWSNPFSGGSPVKQGEVNLDAVTGIASGMPVDAPQQSGGNLQANDWRVQDAEYRDGDIWMSTAIACNPGSGTVNCVRWAQIDPSGPSVVDAGVIGTDSEYRSFPDLAVDACGNMMMGYSKTSSSTNPGVYAVGRDNTGAIQSELTVKAAEAVYDAFDGSPHRWGDYTEMTISPDGSTFWYLGEYSKDSNFVNGNWGTWVNSFTFGCDGGGGSNTPPVAIIDPPPSCTDLTCSFTGSNSSDSDGMITNYAWDFGDGDSSSESNPSHSYASSGTYNVSLTVTDDGGASDTANTSVTVDDGINIPPTAVITMISCNDADKSCSYNGSGSSDSDGNINSYAWSFGDGNTGSGITTNHTYADYGTYTVSLMVTDDGGAQSTNNASESITLTEPGDATTMSVASIFVDTVNIGGGRKSPRATVVIIDDQGSPVGSVDVSGLFTGNAGGSDTGTTNGSGSAVLTSPTSKKGRVKFTFCVTDVTGSATLNWDGNGLCASN